MNFFNCFHKKNCLLWLNIVLLLISSSAQTDKSDTLNAHVAPAKELKKIEAGDTAVKKNRPPLADSSVHVRDSLQDTSRAKKKGSGLTDSVFYGTEGGYIDYDVEKKSMRLVHNATVKYQNLTLYADTIIYHIDDAVFEASGKPQLIEGLDTTIGETMIYNIKTHRGRVRYASTHMNDAYFNGTQIVKSPKNEIYIDQGTYTTCAYPLDPHYFFYGKNIKMIPDDKIICRPVVLAIGDAPIGILPFIWFPIQKNRKSGLLTPSWGGHPESGGYIDNLGYYWAINDYADLSLSTKVQEFQEFVFNGASSYSKKYQLNGNISGHYTYNGDFAQRNQQWSLNYSHNQILSPDNSLTLSGSGNLVSNQTYYRDFSEDNNELLNQSISANMSLAKRFESINASGNLTWDRQQNLKTNEISDNLPSVSFSLPSRSLIPVANSDNSSDAKSEEPAWYNKITYSYNARGLQKIHSGNADSLNYKQKEIAQSFNLSSPLTLMKWFTINPNFSANMYTFDKYSDTSAYDTSIVQDTTFDTLDSKPDDMSEVVKITAVYDQSNQDTVYTYKKIKSIEQKKVPLYKTHNKWTNNYGWNAGLGLSTTLYGIYPVNLFNFVGIRHTMTPSINYQFTPEHDLDKKYNAIIGNESAHKKSQTVSLSVRNEFQGKIETPSKNPGEKPHEDKFQILSASLSTGYNFEADSQKWQDLNVSASTGYSIFKVSMNSDFWMYNNGRLSYPLLKNYSITVSPNALSAQGTIWEGDKIVANGIFRKDDPLYEHAGPQSWKFSLGPSYSFNQSRASLSDPFVTTRNYSLSASASLNFTRKWSASWSSYYNFVTNQMVGHNLHFHCDLECWEMVFDWQPSGSYNAGYYFKVNIKKLPEIFWEKRD